MESKIKKKAVNKNNLPLWQIANPIGRPPKFKNAKDLWKASLKYFQWADDNPIPITSKQAISKKSKNNRDENGIAKAEEVAHRPYTLYGLCAYLNISEWHTFKYNSIHRVADSADFQAVIRAIENVITSQQVDGAMAGLYNANLTARLNGIRDNQDITTQGDKIAQSKEDIMKELDKLRSQTEDIQK